MASTEHFPGMTRNVSFPADAIVPSCDLLDIANQPLFTRPVIVIATASISDSNIYLNGLYQNCFILYRLAEAIGWLPIFVVQSKPKNLEGIPKFFRKCRLAEIEELLAKPLPVKVYLEIGMSLSSNLRRFMKMCGARNVKLYLGNILNIDIETPMFFEGVNFSHHVIGEQDEIWVSPHYAQHLEYAAYLNQVEPDSAHAKIAPYVWDPCIFTNDGERNINWRPRLSGEKPCIVIIEPNISFQKTALIPLLIIEEYARKYPGQELDIIVYNGERFTATQYFKHMIEPNLTIFKKNWVKMEGRHDIISILTKHPHATVLCHQMSNEYNYMIFELLWSKFPVIHNSTAWKTFGYSYPEQDIDKGVELLHHTLHNHDENLEVYTSHAKALVWKHSIYNPEVQQSWKELLESCTTK